MNILLLSMPDSFEHMPAAGVRMPNGALSSLAGNVDAHHQVAVADLILVQRRVRETLVRLVHQLKPDLVGLSIMTFQRKTAKAIIDLIRALKPNAQIVVGDYDPMLATESYTGSGPGQVDFIVRGEGEITFRDLLRAIESGSPYDHIPGRLRPWRPLDFHRMYVIGGLIVGNPSDTRESIQANLLFAQRYIDWPYIQHPTPYPRTPMTKGLRDRGLITSDRVEEYDGTTAVVACKNLTGQEIEFLRWKVERVYV
jgi:radical SAM superfamily enzyme YgiQ (UPF0313 family)